MLSIKRSDQLADTNRLNMWVDPDVCSLFFQPASEPDSAWGVDDFLPLDVLYDKDSGYMDIFAEPPDEFAEQQARLDAAQKELMAVSVGVGAAEGTETDPKQQGGSSSDAKLTKEGEGKEDKEAGAKEDNLEDKSTATDVDVPCDVFLFRNARGEQIYDRLYIEVQMMVFGEVSLKAHPITQAIEQKNASEAELTALADTDLDLIRQATKGGGVSLADLSAQQDNIIATLCPPVTAPSTRIHTADDKGRKLTNAADSKGGTRPGSRDASRPGSALRRGGSSPGSTARPGSRPSSATEGRGHGPSPVSAPMRAVSTIEEKDSVVEEEENGAASLHGEKKAAGEIKAGDAKDTDSSSVTVSATVKYA